MVPLARTLVLAVHSAPRERGRSQPSCQAKQEKLCSSPATGNLDHECDTSLLPRTRAGKASTHIVEQDLCQDTHSKALQTGKGRRHRVEMAQQCSTLGTLTTELCGNTIHRRRQLVTTRYCGVRARELRAHAEGKHATNDEKLCAEAPRS